MIDNEITMDLNDLVAAMEPRLRELIGANIALQLHLERAALWVKADVGQIEQVVVNLITNARDAMPRGGTITVETSRVKVDKDLLSRKLRGGPYGEFPPPSEGWYAKLLVRDDGTGIDATTQANIFLPFFTTKEVGKGTGLGLSAVYGIVNTSRGGILVDSEPGQGACFEVYLPEAGDGVRRTDDSTG
jgi:two-component system, cell cycle sensor histidine kinase and response regulator CckA